MTIFIDTETTGLLKPSPANIEQQPYIIEIYCAKVDDELNLISEFETFVKPPIPIPEHITKITGITDYDVAEAPAFPLILDELVEFFIGERRIVAHNCPFDMGVLWCELSRMGLEFHFPWPPEWFCTVEKSLYLKNKRLKLSQLHEIATGEEHKEGAHRARQDVYALIRCYKWLLEQEEK